MSGPTFEQALRIEAGHPALPGHFPGHPLVPGVVMLEQVALALRAWRGQRLAQMPEVKFLAPLRPCESAMIHLVEVTGTDTRARFEIRRDGAVLARGVVEGTA